MYSFSFHIFIISEYNQNAQRGNREDETNKNRVQETARTRKNSHLPHEEDEEIQRRPQSTHNIHETRRKTHRSGKAKVY